LSVKMGSPFAKPLTLSGGNQQKLLFGRWFGRPIRLLILDEPTRGVDVGAKAEIHAVARRFADDGAAVLMTTSDMDELLALSARVLVMAGGEVTAELAGEALTPERIIDAAFQHQSRKDPAA
ncbi:MAG: sugar ABC transporter ATP-binding protein, partial [Martelella sp.]